MICVSSASDHSELKVFPEAEVGQVRHVIVLPEKSREEENQFKVELIPGKVMETDGVNRMRHGSVIEPRPLEGWGYTFYVVTGKDVAAGTLMGVPPGKEPVEEFVAGTPLLIDYNSRLPVVIYTPEEYQIRYRIWEAGKEQVAGD